MIEIIRRVVCDRCGACGPEVLESEFANAAAEAEGWTCGFEDVCPVCAARKNDAPQA